MSAAVDYVEDVLSRPPGGAGLLGIPELVELDADLAAGEATGSVLADRFEVSTRTIERRRKKLRALGYRCPLPEWEVSEASRSGSSVRRRLQNERRRRG